MLRRSEEGDGELGPEAGVLELAEVQQVQDARQVLDGEDLVDLAEVVREALACRPCRAAARRGQRWCGTSGSPRSTAGVM